MAKRKAPKQKVGRGAIKATPIVEGLLIERLDEMLRCPRCRGFRVEPHEMTAQRCECPLLH